MWRVLDGGQPTLIVADFYKFGISILQRALKNKLDSRVSAPYGIRQFLFLQIAQDIFPRIHPEQR